MNLEELVIEDVALDGVASRKQGECDGQNETRGIFFIETIVLLDHIKLLL